MLKIKNNAIVARSFYGEKKMTTSNKYEDRRNSSASICLNCDKDICNGSCEKFQQKKSKKQERIMEEEKFEWEYDEYDAGCYDIKEEDEEEGLDWNN